MKSTTPANPAPLLGRVQPRARRLCRLAIFLCALGLAGCGPQFSLLAGLKGVTQDVVLGGGRKPSPPPPQLPIQNAYQPPVIPLPGLITPPPARAALPSPPPPPDCPRADPFAVPAVPATNLSDTPPSKGAPYRYRYSGKSQIGSAPVQVLPTAGTREVTDAGPASVPGETGAFRFVYVETYNGVAVSTTYTVVPQDPASNNPLAQSTTAGIYLSETSSADGKYAFKPQAPGLQQMPFPALTSKSFGSSASDPTLQETETLQPDVYFSNPFPFFPGPSGSDQHSPGTKVVGKDRVDACGVIVDAWQVELVGTFNSPSAQLTFDNLVDFATEYGGLPIWEHTRVQGSQNDPKSGKSQTIMLDEIATISQLPRKAQ
ncbi:MAG: hypothetical protein ABR573_08995 [Candidatus Dormibacteria bacterium]